MVGMETWEGLPPGEGRHEVVGLKCESASRRFQTGEGPSRSLLRDCENDGSFAALVWCLEPGVGTSGH